MEFQGLQNSLPDIFTVILVLLVLLLSWYSYKRYSSISLSWKLLLSSLRASALLILLFLFLNPFFKTTREVIVKPKIAVILDASESVSINKGEYKGNVTYQEVIANLRSAPSSYDLEFFDFGDQIQRTDPDQFSPLYPKTNIFNAIENISTSEVEYASAILVSDGIITSGKNPVLLAQNSAFPIHVMGIGDTTRVKDVSIRNISTNGTGFTNTKHLIGVNLSQFGFDNKTVTIDLKSGELILDTKKINLTNDIEVYDVEFEIENSTPGLKQFQVEVSPTTNEWTVENNTSSFSIEVLDSKKRILHIASSIHPDIKALRSILASDENIELSTYTSLGSMPAVKNLFDSDDYDLIILHGKPTPKAVSEFDLSNKDISTLFILLPDRVSILSSENYNLIDTDSPELFEVQLQRSSQNTDHPVLELEDVNLLTFAPIESSINAFKNYPDAITLFTAHYQNIPTNSPVVSVLEQGNIRKSDFNAAGWFKMYLSPNNNERNFIKQLVLNLVDWTSSNPDNRLLKISPSKNSFNTSELPIINASLINENGEVESSGIIEVTIQGSDFAANYTMNSVGDGNYKLQIPNLANGKYEFTATARKGSRKIDTQNGEFLISESSVELANTIRNDDLLRNIALNSSGIFIEHSSIEGIWDMDEINNSLTSRKEVQENYIFPVRKMFWFVVVLFLLGLEWIVRKRFALP
ncbi:MAG: hypothetical protein JJ892_03495 [Balneola sp.]|nr:hypothetical protein [Balneola sp.]MBO6650722.1 hypothetical protein [Balneola sp.]MBO6710634.1 hypothetical protein [Balneola sp.]MBO6799320.1 hypothetical protein [Balneola sp.]MBO6869551.1 hypothetical protein [Balneola sp.]